MSRFPLVERWEIVDDSARGRRRVWRDRAGRVAAVESADGRVLQIARDSAGRLLRADDGNGAFLAIHPEGPGALAVQDPHGVTRVESHTRGYSLQRGCGALRFEFLPDGRLARAFLPGSARALEYVWRPGGGCRIGDAIEIDGRRIATALGELCHTPQPLGMEIQAGPAAVRIGWDGLGRTVFRRWNDGASEFFERDSAGRLSSWTQGDATRLYHYQGAELAAESEGRTRWERTLDAAGRVVRRGAVTYEYDAAGRRIRRGHVRYAYDGFGQLTAAGAHCFQYDGLGRRVAVDDSRVEHRDAEGRLWAVTDAAGRSLHTFIWWQGRMLARLDGPPGSPVAEVFATDHLGTLLGVWTANGFERCAQPPFGVVASAVRPTLYGHVGDPETGLALFGARYYDPELGLFLTPDPWHGGPDDPRLWGAATPRDLHRGRELALGGIHPYALCQFDPAGLADCDGHQSKSASTGMSVLNGIGTFFLLPTWGWPLTAVSLFFFFPFDLYVEAVALLVALFRFIFSGTGGFWDNHPFEQQSVLRSVGAMGSSRQGVVAASLNGLLPRFFTSLHFDSTKSLGAEIGSAIAGAVQSDRAVTIGNCVWMDRYEMNRLERPSVVMVETLLGFSTGTVVSIVVMESGGAGKKRFHASYWSRGFGNKLAAPGAGKLHFDDVAPAGGTAQAAIHLAQPFPLSFPLDKKANPSLQEYLKAAGVSAEAKVIRDAWWALKTGTGIKIKKDDPLEIAAADLAPPNTVHMTCSDVQTDDDFSTIILSGVLPENFRNQKMTVWRVNPTGAETHDWKKGADDSQIKSVAPGEDILGLKLAADALVKITGTAPPAPPPPAAGPPPGAAPAVPLVQYSRVKTVSVALELSDALTANAKAADKVFLLEPGSDSAGAEALDPPVADKFKWTGSHIASTGDLVSITLGAGEAAKVTFGVVKDNADADTLEVELAAPELGAAAKAAVSVRKLKDKTGDDETASVVSDANDKVPVKVARLGVFSKGLTVHFKVDGKDQIRSIKSIAEIGLALVEKPAGVEPFTLQIAALDDDSRVKKAVIAKLHRFLEYQSGTRPADFGTYPDFILNVGPKGFENYFFRMSNCFTQGGDGGFDPNFHFRWKPVSVGGKDYFVLDKDLPFEEDGAEMYWRFEPDDPSDVGRMHFTGAGAHDLVTIYKFQKAGGAVRPTVIPAEPLVLVPEHPSEADTHAEALRQHELHHAQQNTHWGPLMGALPIAGVERIVELALTSGADKAKWLEKDDEEKAKTVQQFHGMQYVSMGGLMQLAWMYFFTWGKGHSVRFETWNRVFNPLAGNIIAKFPDLDPDAPLSKKPGTAILQIINTFTDLRSWTPFIGWVPAWLPDGPCSFLEQGASRASGDCYSTILSADDKFNYQTGLRCSPHVGPTSTDANLTKPVGQAVRLLLFPANRDHHTIRRGIANLQDSPAGYAEFWDPQELLTITSSVDVLAHPDLFEFITPAAAPATVALPAPASIAGGAAVNFVTIPANTKFRPTLRAMTPMPPAVNRTVGWYFLPMTPATYDFVAYYRDATDDGKNAKTQEVHLTFNAADVTFGGDKVDYAAPAVAAPASKFDRFIGEEPVVVIDKQPFKDAAWWELNATDGAGAALPADFVKKTATATGWKLKVANGKLAGPDQRDVRVRIYRIAAADDPVFDLTFDPKKHPTLANVRSYLEKTIWFPVRDFVFTVKNMPPLAADLKPKIKSEDPYLLNLALPLTGKNAPVTSLVPPAPTGNPPAKLELERTGKKGTQPRGEEWRVKPVGGVLEDTAKYKIAVTYDSGVTPDPIELTIDPFIKIDKAGGQAGFVATEASPCLLDISGGAAPYTVSTENFPSAASAGVSGARITVGLKNLSGNTKGTVVVTDKDGKKGRRTVQLQKM